MAKFTPITNQIRTLRFHTNEMTQAELAEKVGVTRQTVIAIEQGKYSPLAGSGLQDRPDIRRRPGGRVPVSRVEIVRTTGGPRSRIASSRAGSVPDALAVA